ncbi:MAG: hypothetical protein MZV63_72100 [Marinilabiliales bacterium]|nr:hypothetical protein [Marinilabiliales bacterium]
MLGIHNETAYYLLYNGILGDIDPKGGNALTSRVLRQLPKHKGKKVIYGEMSMLEASVLRSEEITFKHIPIRHQGAHQPPSQPSPKSKIRFGGRSYPLGEIMFTLKKYQTETLDLLRQFLEEARFGNHARGI